MLRAGAPAYAAVRIGENKIMISKAGLASVAVAASALISATGCGSTSAHGSAPVKATANQPPAQLQPAEPEGRPAIIRLVARAGTALRVRLNNSLDTARFRPGDRFTGVLASPVAVQGRTLIQRGANVEGIVRTSSPSGRFKGRAVLGIAIDRVEIDGAMMRVVTDSVVRSSGAHKKRNFTIIGGGAGLGALIGGLAAGGRGALIGAGAGAATGSAGAALTGRKQVRIPAESVLVFRLRQALTVNLPDNQPERASVSGY